MSPWAKRLLMMTMIAWTALTVAAGWFAFRGGSTSASASDHTVLYDVAKPGAAREVRAVTREQASKLIDANAGATAVATPSSLGLRAAPQFARDAGINSKIGAASPDGPRSSEQQSHAKGVIVLDPGHGRGDPGAVHHLADGSVDITEADSNLRNAELLRDDLIALGYEVYLTRDGAGRGPAGPLPLEFIASDLYARVGLAKAVNADLYLAIHGNGATVTSISGPETWYCGRHQAAAANEQLARAVQSAMMDALHEYGYAPPDRGIKEDAQSHHSGDFCQFVVTRESPVPAALLEFLFLTNDDDARVLVDDRAHVLMARHVADALDAFMRDRGSSPASPTSPSVAPNTAPATAAAPYPITPQAVAAQATPIAPPHTTPARIESDVPTEAPSQNGFFVPDLIDPPTPTPEIEAAPQQSPAEAAPVNH